MLNDKAVDLLIGRRPGYISLMRSISNAVEYLVGEGLDRKKLAMLTDGEIINMRARMLNPDKPTRANAGSFHRPDVPKCGIQIITPRGPQVVVVCSGQNAKRKVIAALRRLAEEIA